MPTSTPKLPSSDPQDPREFLRAKIAGTPTPAAEVDSDAMPAAVAVIPLDEPKTDRPWSLRVPSTSSADKAYHHLRDLQSPNGPARRKINLPDVALRDLADSTYDTDELARVQLLDSRTSSGFLSVVETRGLTLCFDLAADNVRHNEDADYAADPASRARAGAAPAKPGLSGRAPAGMYAMSLPTSDPCYAQLRQLSSDAAFAEAADVNSTWVLKHNPQEVGHRIVETPLTVVFTVVVDPNAPGRSAELRKPSKDGNGRLAKALSKIPVELSWLPNVTSVRDACKKRLARGAQPLLPSHLLLMTTEQRRALTRRVATEYSKVLAQPDLVVGTQDGAGGTVTLAAARAQRLAKNVAAEAINSLTVPVRVVVGFVDDDRTRGNSGFASAIADVLKQMNAEGSQLKPGASAGFLADSVVPALRDAGVIGAARSDILLGRERFVDACHEEGIDPDLPDLRAAVVVRELTRNTRSGNKHLGRALGIQRVTIKERGALAGALVLRSYHRTVKDNGEVRETQIRRAVDTGLLWQDLVGSAWEVANVTTDGEVDMLLELALDEHGSMARSQDRNSSQLLGVLGMCALVFSGHLIAPGGAAEQKVGAPINREPVGKIIEQLLKHPWGLRLLADAIKRNRAGQALRWVDDETGELVSAPAAWGPADYNNHLRAAVRHAKPTASTSTSQQQDLWNTFEASVDSARSDLQELRGWREEVEEAELLPWPQVEATVLKLERIAQALRSMAEQPPVML